MFEMLFNIVAVSMFITLFYLQFKLFFIAASLRNRNGKYRGKVWNGRFTKKQIILLRSVADEKSQNDIDMGLRYLRLTWKIVATGFFLLIVIIWFNRILNVE